MQGWMLKSQTYPSASLTRLIFWKLVVNSNYTNVNRYCLNKSLQNDNLKIYSYIRIFNKWDCSKKTVFCLSCWRSSAWSCSVLCCRASAQTGCSQSHSFVYLIGTVWIPGSHYSFLFAETENHILASEHRGYQVVIRWLFIASHWVFTKMLRLCHGCWALLETRRIKLVCCMICRHAWNKQPVLSAQNYHCVLKNVAFKAREVEIHIFLGDIKVLSAGLMALTWVWSHSSNWSLPPPGGRQRWALCSFSAPTSQLSSCHLRQ